MRDPDGIFYFENKRAYRKISENSVNKFDFLRDKTLQVLLEKYLVKYNFISDDTLEVEKIKFVTYPSEWTNSQLYDAGLLTLNFSKFLFNHNYELKDSNAWNIVFYGTAPFFCDHFSIRIINTKVWIPFYQYLSNFIFPLLIFKSKKLNIRQIFKISRDGATEEITYSLLRNNLIFSMLNFLAIRKGTEFKAQSFSIDNSYHPYVYDFLNIFLTYCKPNFKTSFWTKYKQSRPHYTGIEITQKNNIINKWIREIKPQNVIDYGCNTGEYTKLALSSGATVIAVDKDHDSIDHIYRNIKSNYLYCVVADITDLNGGLGWKGEEFSSLHHRLIHFNSDLVLMLAVLHHLCVVSSIPINEVAKFSFQIAHKFLILELISPDDETFKKMIFDHQRDKDSFTIDKQLNHFLNYFQLISQVRITESRVLVLLKRRD